MIDCFALILIGNKLRIVNDDSKFLWCVKNAVERSGLIFSEKYNSSAVTTLKLNRQIFAKGTSSANSKLGKLTVLNLIRDLYERGYTVCASSSFTKSVNNSSLFFTKLEEDVKGAGSTIAKFCCVAPSKRGLQFYDCPRQLVAAFGEGVGITSESDSFGSSVPTSNGSFKFSLNCDPWSNTAQGSEKREGRIVMIKLLKTFFDHGYAFHCRVNIKDSTDCLIFMNGSNKVIDPVNLSMMSLDKSDRIRFIHAPSYITGSLAEAISEYWPVTRQSSTGTDGELQLEGRPWLAAKAEDSLAVRKLMCAVLQRLLSLGFRVVATLDISKKLTSKSCFILQECTPDNMSKVTCISVNSDDCLRFVNFPSSESSSLMELVRTTYQKGSETKIVGDTDEAKLRGSPWSSTTHDAAEGVALLSVLMNTITHRFGYSLLTSASVSGKQQGDDNGSWPNKAHSWFFVKQSIF